MSREFDKTKDCANCLREIDEVTVKLKKLTIGPDTYRRYKVEDIKNFKYEKICHDCFYGKPVIFKREETNDNNGLQQPQ